MSKESAQAVAERVVSNVTVTAIARVSMIVASLLGVPLGAWTLTSIVDLRQRMTMTEESRRVTRGEIVHRLELLESQNRSEADVWRRVVERLAGLEATQQSTLRAMERIERGLDRDRRGGSP